MARRLPKVGISIHDRSKLERWIHARTTEQRLALRSRIVLLLADGFSARETGRRLGVSRQTVGVWRKRYETEGIDTLARERPGRGRKPGRKGRSA